MLTPGTGVRGSLNDDELLGGASSTDGVDRSLHSRGNLRGRNIMGLVVEIYNRAYWAGDFEWERSQGLPKMM